jgi:hypothetical protein
LLSHFPDGALARDLLSFVFLNERPEAELPLIALHTNPQGRHIALQVESLEALRTLCADAKARGIPVSDPIALDDLERPEGEVLERIGRSA